MFQVRKKLETGDTWKGKAQNEKENITNPTNFDEEWGWDHQNLLDEWI